MTLYLAVTGLFGFVCFAVGLLVGYFWREKQGDAHDLERD